MVTWERRKISNGKAQSLMDIYRSLSGYFDNDVARGKPVSWPVLLFSLDTCPSKLREYVMGLWAVVAHVICSTLHMTPLKYLKLLISPSNYFTTSRGFEKISNAAPKLSSRALLGLSPARKLRRRPQWLGAGAGDGPGASLWLFSRSTVIVLSL